MKSEVTNFKVGGGVLPIISLAKGDAPIWIISIGAHPLWFIVGSAVLATLFLFKGHV